MKAFRIVVEWCRNFAEDWDRFWFTPADGITLCVLRWLVGGMAIYTHVVWGLKLESFFGRNGFQSAAAIHSLSKEDFLWSFWWLVPDEHLRLFHTLGLVLLVLFWIGCWTRFTSVLALLITISNSHRALTANYGLDQILTILIFYLAIGHCGDRLSVDAWIRKRHARHLGKKRTKTPVRVSSGLALRLIQFHYCLIYLVAGLSKLQGEAWWNGEALWLAIANSEYQSYDLTSLARYSWFLQGLAHATIAWEISFPVMIWKPRWKAIYLTFGMAVHLGIGAFLGMWTFGLAMLFGYLAFLDVTSLKMVLHSAGFMKHRPRSEKVFPDAAERDSEISSPLESIQTESESFRPNQSSALVVEDSSRSDWQSAPIHPVERSDEDDAEWEVLDLYDEPAQTRLRESMTSSQRFDAVVFTRQSSITELQEYLKSHGWNVDITNSLSVAIEALQKTPQPCLIWLLVGFTKEEISRIADETLHPTWIRTPIVFVLGADQLRWSSILEARPWHRALSSPCNYRQIRQFAETNVLACRLAFPPSHSPKPEIQLPRGLTDLIP